MANDHTILAVFGHTTECSVDESLRETAAKYNLPFFDTNINKMVDEVKKLDPEYLFSVQYGPILKKPILDVPEHGCWNLHCGDLPRYGGCKVVLQAIWNGEHSVGITFHKMDEGIDTGPAVCKGYVHVNKRTAKELYPYLNDSAFYTFQRGVSILKSTNNHPVYVSYMEPKLYYRMTALDMYMQKQMRWDETMEECRRRYAAFTLIDGTVPITDRGEKVIDLRIEPKEPVSIRVFGERLKVENGRQYIAVRDGVISCELCPK